MKYSTRLIATLATAASAAGAQRPNLLAAPYTETMSWTDIRAAIDANIVFITPNTPPTAITNAKVLPMPVMILFLTRVPGNSGRLGKSNGWARRKMHRLDFGGERDALLLARVLLRLADFLVAAFLTLRHAGPPSLASAL